MSETKTKDSEECSSSETQATITVAAVGGNIECKVQVLQSIPYFEPLLSGRWNHGDSVSCDIFRQNLYPCVAYAESGCERLSVLLTKLESAGDAAEVVKTLQFLCMNVPTVTTLEELLDLEKVLKDTKSETIARVARKTYCRSYDIPHRMTATKLCFAIIQESLNFSDNKIKQKVVNDVLYVVSHAKTFGPRLRRHVWNAFESRVPITPKQRSSQFSQWVTEQGLTFDLYKDSSDDEGSATDCDCTTGSIHEEDWLGDY